MTARTSISDGRYLLVEQLGEGGMATVFRAFDQRLQVWRAIKILLPQFANKPRLKARFEAEAQTMALLEDRNIVRVYDVGSVGSLSFIVMELIEAGSLVDWLDDYGPMPPRMACEVTLQLCKGVEAAHDKGVIHRDIKPHNVLVSKHGVCKVTDFGIARVGDSDASMTKTGAVMGTWGYMAPEQRSDAKNVDERADVYAIGATLYTLLTNKMPMDLFASDRDDTMMDGVDARLVSFLVACTEYRREDRPASVTALSTLLEQTLADIGDDPDDTPELVHISSERRVPPTAEEAARMPPLHTVAEVGGSPRPAQSTRADLGDVGQTLLPGEQGGHHSPTMAPGEWSPNDPGLNAQQSRGLYTSGYTPSPVPRHSTPSSSARSGTPTPAAPFGAIDPSMDSATAPPGAHHPARGGGMVWLVIGGMAVAGLALLLVAGVILIPALTGGDPAPVAEHVAVVAPEEPSAVPAADTGAEQPKGILDGGGKPPPKRPKKTTKRPKAPTKEPAPPTPAVADPVEPEPVAEPAGISESPAEGEQCVKAKVKSISSADRVRFEATVCTPTKDKVTLHFRPVGDSAWQTRVMPQRLGSRFTTIDVDERYNKGIEYYVDMNGAQQGSAAKPQVFSR